MKHKLRDIIFPLPVPCNAVELEKKIERYVSSVGYELKPRHAYKLAQNILIKFNKCGRAKKRFIEKEASYLSSPIQNLVNSNKKESVNSEKKESSFKGRKPFNLLSISQKRRRMNSVDPDLKEEIYKQMNKGKEKMPMELALKTYSNLNLSKDAYLTLTETSEQPMPHYNTLIKYRNSILPKTLK